MITVEEAKQLIQDNINPLAEVKLAVPDSLGFYLAETIISPINVPSFNQSAMDGYAFNYCKKNNLIPILGEVAAGDTNNIVVKNKGAVRIFTGAKVPDYFDTVVMQELTETIDGKLKVKDVGLKQGGNIRLKGSQIKKGDVALEKNTLITPAAIGFLSALGLTKVKVYRNPKVAIIATGNELVKPGNELKEGQIYESNTFMLESALKAINIHPTIAVVEDNQKLTQQAIEKAVNNNDVVLLSGGISVGDYDFVKRSLDNLGVEDIFYKVKQKPGKPLYFGKTDSCYVFALPGNPAAALTCFYQYVNSAITILKGGKDFGLIKLKLPLYNKLTKKVGRSVFYKAFTDFKTVNVLEGQGSDMLKSFAIANCLAYIPAEVNMLDKNELVEIYLLP